MKTSFFRFLILLLICSILLSGYSSAEEDRPTVKFDLAWTKTFLKNYTVDEIYNDSDLRAKFVYYILHDYCETDPDLEESFVDFLLNGAYVVGSNGFILSLGYISDEKALFIIYVPAFGGEVANYLELDSSQGELTEQLAKLTYANADEYCEVTIFEILTALQSSL